MKKSSLLLHMISMLSCIAALALSGCQDEKTSADGKLGISCGLPPAAYLVRRIGGERTDVFSILPEGRTPHDFSPRAATVQKAARSAIFFTTGQTFERKIASALTGKTRICDISGNISRIHFSDGSGRHHHCSDHNCANHDDGDPHVWLSAKNAVIMAENITAALISADPAGAEIYRKNCAALVGELQKLDREIALELKPFAGRTFFVYHPAFGYFARDYQLRQRAVELNGREAGAAGIAEVIREAKAAGASTVFVQKQFNPRTARALAERIGGTVEFLDPLAWDLMDNLRRSARAIAAGFSGKDK